MESDERFKHLASDPRFKTLRRKQSKVEEDDRFLITENFTSKCSKDKRGRKQKKTREEIEDDNDDENGDENSEEKNSSEEKEEKKEEEDNDEADEDSEVEPESELSSSSDESESGEEDEAGELDIKNIEYDWQPLDYDAETAETTTRRLAIQHLDWDHMDVKDIYTLINSVRPPLNVRIYVSEFGKERLKQEELEGPKELVDMPKVDECEEEYNDLKGKLMALKDPRSREFKVNEYEDADEELDPKNEEIRERIRKYQLSKMKYYYAIAEFDSIESAEVVYKELDGMEYEGSSLELDLRFVPDDIEFDPEDIKAECDKLPDLASYKAPQFINSALQQTTVKFTWDETDIKRQEKLHKAYTKEELEKDDLDAYLASETDSEEDEIDEEANDSVSVVTANSEARANKYRMLLKSLEEEEENKKKVDVDVEWGNYSEEEKEVAEANEDEDEFVDEDVDSFYDSDENQSAKQLKKPDKTMKGSKKAIKKKGRKKKNMEEEAEDDGELDLLVMDVGGSKRDEFKFDPEDDRFNAVYEDENYNRDPCNSKFKRTEASEMIAKIKRKKTEEKREKAREKA